MQTWRVDDRRQSMVLASRSGRLPQVVYWDARLPDDEDLATIAAAYEIDLTGGMLDVAAPLSILPELAQGFPGQPGMILRGAGGQHIAANFTLKDAQQSDQELTLGFRDADNQLNYTARITSDPETNMLTLAAELEAEQPVFLDWLAAPVLPAPQNAKVMTDFSGRWCGEFQENTVPWTPGIRLRENLTGRTGHEHFPGLVIPCVGATNTQGEVYGWHYGWSGGHRMIAEELPDGRRQVQMGHAFGTQEGPGTRFATAPLYATYSDTGMNGIGVSYQRHLRRRIVNFPNPDRPRPVHYNCWEAVYFDHKPEELFDIARRAADLGAERFVLDDGWFATRDDDTQSLGDWDVDLRKYPSGLTPLARHVQSLGMTFGLWLEPEMVSPDSDLFRAHPDWALGAPDQPLGRGQMVLNMALSEVREHLFGKISALLSQHAIDYIKWDHNRVLPLPGSQQTQGTYMLLDQLRQAFPQVEIESCASGGGRIDFGILGRTHRVWLSDSNDALERLKIQHRAAIFLPACVTGSHVGPRKCHTSGRTLGMSFRAWVAAQRHMGFEMDPHELDDAETRVLQSVTAWWKSNRSWMMGADILRLDAPDRAVVAELQLAADKSRFVAFIAKAETSDQIAPRPIRLTGLDPEARYRIDLINRDEASALSRGAPALKDGPIEVSGTYLLQHGLALPWSLPETIWVLEGERL